MRLSTLLALSLTFAACSSDGPTESGPGAVSSVSITPSVPRIELPGQVRLLTANARDENGVTVPDQVFTWTSADPSIATVASDGVVTAAAAGSVTIVAATGSVTGSVTLQVTGITDIDFLLGDWVATRDGSGETTGVGFVALTGGILEETRTRSGGEIGRGLTRLDNGIWLYARADAERRRMQYFTGQIENGANRATAVSVDGMNRVVIGDVSTEGFTLRLQTDVDGSWVDESTDRFAR